MGRVERRDPVGGELRRVDGRRRYIQAGVGGAGDRGTAFSWSIMESGAEEAWREVAANCRQIGRKTFFQRGDRLVDSTATEAQEKSAKKIVRPSKHAPLSVSLRSTAPASDLEQENCQLDKLEFSIQFAFLIARLDGTLSPSRFIRVNRSFRSFRSAFVHQVQQVLRVRFGASGAPAGPEGGGEGPLRQGAVPEEQWRRLHAGASRVRPRPAASGLCPRK